MLLQPNVSPLYLHGKTKNNTKRPTDYTAVRSAERIVPNFCRKSFDVRFPPSLLENSFRSLLTENILHSRGFYQKFIFKLNMVNFCM